MYIWLLVLWGVINIPGLIWIIHHVLLSDNQPLVVLFAPVWSICSNGAKATDLSLAGQIMITIFYTALFLPAIVAYYAILIIMLVALGLTALYCLIFMKRDKRKRRN